jgi:hypothetical protein
MLTGDVIQSMELVSRSLHCREIGIEGVSGSRLP